MSPMWIHCQEIVTSLTAEGSIAVRAQLIMRQAGSHDGGHHGNQAEGHCACAVAVVARAAVCAALNGEDGGTSSAAGAVSGTGTGQCSHTTVNFDHNFGACVLRAAA